MCSRKKIELLPVSGNGKLEHLAQGNIMTLGIFIQKSHIPQVPTVIYGRIVVAYCLQKADPYQTQLTIGGNHLHYPHDASTSIADITTIKLLLNSTIFTPNARFLALDIKNYYLGAPLDQYDYMCLPISIIPTDIATKYKLHDLSDSD